MGLKNIIPRLLCAKLGYLGLESALFFCGFEARNPHKKVLNVVDTFPRKRLPTYLIYYIFILRDRILEICIDVCLYRLQLSSAKFFKASSCPKIKHPIKPFFSEVSGVLSIHGTDSNKNCILHALVF